MNKQNIDKAIAVMQRVIDNGYCFDMHDWQTTNINVDDYWTESNSIFSTEKELANSCGTAACFAGWVAVSDEFKQDGGGPGLQPLQNGVPMLNGTRGPGAISQWLDIPCHLSIGLCGVEPDVAADVYGTEDMEKITPYHVLDALKKLRAGEFDYLADLYDFEGEC